MTAPERSRGPLGSLLVGVVVAAVVGGLVCGGLPGALTPLPRQAEPLRDHLTLLGVILIECLVIAFAMLPALAARTRDAAFYEDDIAQPRGWTVDDAGAFLARLTGRHQARAVQLVASMGRHSPYRNPGQLRLYVSADAGRRIHLTTRSRGALVADLRRGLNLLHLPELPELAGLASDAEGARAWLAWPDVAAAARRLLDQPADTAVLLRVEPDAVVLTLNGQTAHGWDGAQLDAWLADLSVLAEGLETIGPPTPREAPWGPEHTLQHDPGKTNRRGALSCLGCAGVLGLVYLGSAAAVLASQLL